MATLTKTVRLHDDLLDAFKARRMGPLAGFHTDNAALVAALAAVVIAPDIIPATVAQIQNLALHRQDAVFAAIKGAVQCGHDALPLIEQMMGGPRQCIPGGGRLVAMG